ncbi:protein NETWORKED 2A [Glycine max]|uniref:protein NETWORKED 2A n=1 Tax=Glycine max TaxID=3847 RepID=UPI0003DE830C|nr:protein NETWORKED 2A [Glycine max]|eukprot:XP_006576060.1 protein NETWORKED 2A [Glycine max]
MITDMEEKVAETLNILCDEGDSFAKRAEMYYKKRPELVDFVEEAFRAYRALAEKYDHLSKELQSANRTIASVFPDQVPCHIEEDDEEESDTGTNLSSPDSNNQPHNKPSIPRVPKTPKMDFRSPFMLLSRKGPLKRISSSTKYVPTISSSGLTKVEALADIDKLQKEILSLQTKKEFERSSYERSYEKYWEIEDQITVTQKRVCSLQDEFGVGTVIEDNDARALMAATALKSCQETLNKLKEIQAQSSNDAKEEYQRVKKAHEKFETLRDQFISKYMNQQNQDDVDKSENVGTDKKCIDEDMEQEEHDVGMLREKIKQKLEEDSSNSLTVTEMAECIDELVNKVCTLETAVSSQTGMVKRLKSETDGLHTNIKKLEEDREMLIEGSEVTNKKLMELEEELRRVKMLNQSVRTQDNTLQTHFTEASCNLEHLSGKLNNMKPDEEEENLVLYKKKRTASDDKSGKKSEKHHDNLSVDNTDVKTIKEDDGENVDTNKSNLNDGSFMNERIQKLVQQDKDDLSDTVSNLDTESQDLDISEEDQPNWRQMFISGLDDREKILLEEYTSVLVNYKDVRLKLNDVEKKNRDSIFELTLQLREMKNALSTKDKEIQVLHQKLDNPDANPDESPYTITTEYKYTPQEALLRKAGQGANVLDSENSPSNLDANAAASPLAEQVETESTGKNAFSSVRMTLEKLMAHQDKCQDLSNLEQKFRSDIDNLLEENLEFWLRFSTSVHQIQKFQNSIQDLKAELKTIRDKNKKSEGYSHSKQQPIQSQLRPIFRHLREIRTELSLWVEHNAVLHDELQGRYASLSNIQDEIARAGNTESGADTAELISKYQVAKFQGEILNMKQENSKVASELQAGLTLVKGMKTDVEKTLDELDEAIGVNSGVPKNNGEMNHSTSRARIPLRSFLFGVKLKKQKHHPSLFACVNPALQRQYSVNDEAPAPI